MSTGETSERERWFAWIEWMGWRSFMTSCSGALDTEERDLVDEGFAPISSFDGEAPISFSFNVSVVVAFDTSVALLVLRPVSGGARPDSRSFSFSMLATGFQLRYCHDCLFGCSFRYVLLFGANADA